MNLGDNYYVNKGIIKYIVNSSTIYYSRDLKDIIDHKMTTYFIVRLIKVCSRVKIIQTIKCIKKLDPMSFEANLISAIEALKQKHIGIVEHIIRAIGVSSKIITAFIDHFHRPPTGCKNISNYLLPGHIDDQIINICEEVIVDHLREDTLYKIFKMLNRFIGICDEYNRFAVRIITKLLKDEANLEQEYIDKNVQYEELSVVKLLYRLVSINQIKKFKNRQIQDLYINSNMPIRIYFLIQRGCNSAVTTMLKKGVDIKLYEDADISDKITQIIAKYVSIEQIITSRKVMKAVSKYIDLPKIECDICCDDVITCDTAAHKCSVIYCSNCAGKIKKCKICDTRF